MSWVCLVCECIHALCLINFARPSFPSFFGWSCWFVAQLNPIAQQTAEWRSCRPCLHLRTNLGPRIAFWGPDLGHILAPVSGSIFGHRFGPLYNYKQNPGPQNRAQKWNPKQGPKYDPNQAPKCNPRPQFVRRRKQGRVEMIIIQRPVCLAILFNCATNQ